MATLICPNCEENSFNWITDEEISELTIWGCNNCSYEAFENESDVRNCSKCGKKTESRLKDTEKEYWWYSSCSATEIIKST